MKSKLRARNTSFASVEYSEPPTTLSAASPLPLSSRSAFIPLSGIPLTNQHVFISYDRAQTSYARACGDHLLKRGFDVWIDDQIDYGNDWQRTIFTAIRNCGALIVTMSPDAEVSDWVQSEVA